MGLAISRSDIIQLRQTYEAYERYFLNLHAVSSLNLIEVIDQCEQTYQALKSQAKSLKNRISDPFSMQFLPLTELLANFKKLH